MHFFKYATQLLMASLGVVAITVAQAQLVDTTPHQNLPANAQMSDCMTCHQSYDAVAKQTENMNPNPHYSHRGDVECTNCHQLKVAPRFECNDCHCFQLKMKGEQPQ